MPPVITGLSWYLYQQQGVAIGSTGYTGYTGPGGSGGSTGYTGYSGYTGYTGAGNFTGYTGFSGYTGYTGPSVTGYTGYSGFTGFTGYTGPGNFTGYSGYTGFTGYTGPGGSSTTGYTGYSGYTGYTGSGNFTGYTGYTGPNITGYTGYTGYTGPGGSTGYSGYTGYTGPGNFTGFTGYTGNTGFTGYTGAGNFTGFTGYSGYTGYTGYTGAGNFTGFTGYTGYTGPIGTTGYTGYSGFSGYTGYTGYTGANGSGFTSQTLTDGANIDWSITAGQLADVTLGGNRNLDNAVNIAKNQFTSLTVYQDSVGGRTLTFGTQYQFNGVTPTLSTGPLLADIFYFTNDGSNQYNTVLTKGFGATFAYFAGGSSTSLTNSLVVNSGLDFNTDTTAQVTKGVLSSKRDELAGANSATNAYFTGGASNFTTGGGILATTESILFSSDTTAMVTKSALLTATWQLSGSNSSTLAYFSGGITAASSGVVAITYGLTFASDTSTIVTKGALATGKSNMGSGNSTTIAYFAGGETSFKSLPVVGTQGLTFASDTVTMVTKGALATAKKQTAGTNSTTIAYFSGGETAASPPGATQQTNTQALTFSTDTTTMVTKGVLATGASYVAGANSGAIGYYAGGFTGGGTVVTITEGLSYASDTTTMVTKGALVSAAVGQGAAQGSKFGVTQIP